MFCTNCGTQFEGNFCPQCGTKAFQPSEGPKAEEEAPVRQYPAPPIGTYSGKFPATTVEVEQESITILKENWENGKQYNTNISVPYSEIAYVSMEDQGKNKISVVCIRTIGNIGIPIPIGIQSMSDPYCAVFRKENKEVAKRIYEFLLEVVKINGYTVPATQGSKSTSFYAMFGAVEKRPASKRERIEENKRNGVACCPKCGSTSISAHKKGYSVLKGWALGAVFGDMGSHKVIITCLNCGHQWKP